jgi:hypothetical protein
LVVTASAQKAEIIFKSAQLRALVIITCHNTAGSITTDFEAVKGIKSPTLADYG